MGTISCEKEGSTIMVFETYSQRLKRRENAGKPIPYRYDLAVELRTQISDILVRALGDPYFSQDGTFWQDLHLSFARAIGSFRLDEYSAANSEACINYFLRATDEEATDF